MEDLRFNDLRHTFATDLTEDAKDLKTTSLLMGHSNTRMTDRYAHLADEHLKKQISKKRSYLGYVMVTLPKNDFAFSLN